MTAHQLLQATAQRRAVNHHAAAWSDRYLYTGDRVKVDYDKASGCLVLVGVVFDPRHGYRVRP